MSYRVLINDAVKSYLLESPEDQRRRLRKSFEFLEAGLWDGGLRVKKLRGLTDKTVLEARVSRAQRLLFTLGSSGDDDTLIHVWGVVDHDRVDRQGRSIVPENAPFLSFEETASREVADIDFGELDSECFSQRDVHSPSAADAGHQRWFVIDERQWRRLLLYQQGEFEIGLYLTPQQSELLRAPLPLLAAGTAGSGKSTLAVYALLRSDFLGKRKAFVTYTEPLRRFSERLYRGLTAQIETPDDQPPEFLTFESLCRRIVPNADLRFRPESEVDLNGFRDVLAKYARKGWDDYALAWEEIRAIIKGGKPQLNAERLDKLIQGLGRGADEPESLRHLREELLGLASNGVAGAVDQVALRMLGKDLRATCAELESLNRTRRLDLTRALEAVRKIVLRKGRDWNQPLMTLSDYEQLGRKRAPNFAGDRREIHALACRYQDELGKNGQWDQIDLTRAALRALDRGADERNRFDLLVCDEVQDFCELQLSLLFRLPRNPRSLLLAGDAKQVINPSGFRWEEAKRQFFDRGLPVPDVRHLTVNFRCVGSIVRLANQLIRLKRRLLGVQSDEKLDEWKFQGRPPCVVESLSAKVLQSVLLSTAADRMILTRAERDRDELKERLGTELVMTVREAKGLEFNAVLLWKFFADPQSAELWRRVADDRAEGLNDALVRHEMNLLYVAVTRARQNLIVYDEPETAAVWEIPEIRELVFRSSDRLYLEQSWQALSTPEDWRRQGDYYLDHAHLRAAGECYRNANRPDLMHAALARDDEKRGRFASAARHWEDIQHWDKAAAALERSGDLESARQIWLRLGDHENALRCLLERLKLQGRHAELAEHFEAEGEFEEAANWWRRARRPERAAELILRLGDREAAAGLFQEAGQPARAAQLYLALKRADLAAGCLEAARDWSGAVALYEKLKDSDSALRCLEAWGDPLRLGQFHEQRKQWEKAFEAYRCAWNNPLKERFEAELTAQPRMPLGPRAIRLHLLGRLADAAPCWEKSGVYPLAATCFDSAGETVPAARCRLKQGDWLEATRLYLTLEDPTACKQGLARSLPPSRRHRMTPAERESLKTLADKTAEDAPDGAMKLYEFLGEREAMAVLAALGDDLDLALRIFGGRLEFEPLELRFTELGRFREGARMFREMARRRRRSYRDIYDLFFSYDNLIAAWIRTGIDEAAMDEIAEHLLEFPYELDPRLVAFALEPRGYYDLTWRCLRNLYADPYGAGEKRLLRSEAETFAARGKPASAGIRWLLLDEPDRARAFFERVPVSENDLRCRIEAGLWREVADHFRRTGRPLEAVRLALEFDDLDLAREAAQESGDLRQASFEFWSFEHYEPAVDLLRECGDLESAARLMESSRRWTRAAELWEELARPSDARRCLSKIPARKKQKKNATKQGKLKFRP